MFFTPIDYERWERKEYLKYFQETAIYITADVDITALYGQIKRRGLRLYPALVYCAARVINQDQAFRYARDAQGNIGLWDVVYPYYTVPRLDDNALFSMKCTAYTADFAAFYEAFTGDYAQAETSGRLLCDPKLPENICGISITPELSFTAFSFGGSPKEDFTPFTLFGRFRREGERILLPVAGEFSHAVNDGLHISRFFQQLEETGKLLFNDV
ncbi:CatA-like O-acetyltransferase [Agathobaculum sp. NTUH-O15-33]|uniref:CatA-like O-acetyltransferase n=1 Tax=Agathobaculum sp. NTUH-O15-33 TaxID=3079302 RepID=UPI00295851E5|nr:CatA-like O-acetyltransferase [Agathobaculum sp. NTUH-O15-33]WNX84849.1 CatA-like O-acetyltransferase [Agathobaculum sp. NTUH-O15-33]